MAAINKDKRQKGKEKVKNKNKGCTTIQFGTKK